MANYHLETKRNLSERRFVMKILHLKTKKNVYKYEKIQNFVLQKFIRTFKF